MRIYKFILTGLKRIISPTSARRYNSIDSLPLYNWQKCVNGSLKYVRTIVKEEDEDNKEDEKVFEKIYDEYIKRFGMGKLYEKWLKIMKKKAIMECDFVITQEKFKLTEIQIEEAKLKGMLDNKGEGTSIEKSLIYLGQWLGYRLNIKEVTTLEYFNLLEEYGKANKKK
jgi:hypothetical protein